MSGLADLPAYFCARIEPEPTSGCWLWTGRTNNYGYGLAQYGGRSARRRGAHVVVWELLEGLVPDGLELDHLCRNRMCVSPWHLEPVTHIVNIRRGRGGQQWVAKTHCPHGHPYDEANTIHYRGHRFCRACKVLSRKKVA